MQFFDLPTSELSRGIVTKEDEKGNKTKYCIDSVKLFYHKNKNMVILTDEVIDAKYYNDKSTNYWENIYIKKCIIDKYELIKCKFDKRVLHTVFLEEESTGKINSNSQNDLNEEPYTYKKTLLTESALVDEDYTLEDGIDFLKFENYVIEENDKKRSCYVMEKKLK